MKIRLARSTESSTLSPMLEEGNRLTTQGNNFQSLIFLLFSISRCLPCVGIYTIRSNAAERV